MKDYIWFRHARVLLSKGYGVEDIALKLNRPLYQVREYVSWLREQGIITNIVRGQVT